MAEAAADAGVPPRALPAALQGARGGVERGRASARFSGGAGARDGSRRVRQCGAAAQCARVQNVRSGRAQSTHGTCSTKCQRALELEGGAGTAQDGGRGNKALSGQGGSVRGSSPSCKPESLPKRTVHTRCSTECQMHLGNSWSGQNLQISVSLDAGDGGKVSLAKTEG